MTDEQLKSIVKEVVAEISAAKGTADDAYKAAYIAARNARGDQCDALICAMNANRAMLREPQKW